MIFLFIGMIASGISGRVTLLSHRGGWFLEDQARKSPGMVAFDLIGMIAGAAAFILSFLLFDWWLPIVALVAGYWIVAPILVNRSRFPFFYQTKFVTAIVALGCSLAICGIYLEVL